MQAAGPRILVISTHQQALLRSVETLRRDLPLAEVHAAATLEQGREAVPRVQPQVVFVLAQGGLLEASLAFCRWLRGQPSPADPSLVLVYPSKDVGDWKRLYEAQGDMYIAWDGNFVEGLASCVRSLVGRRYRLVAAPLTAGSLQLFPEGLLGRIGGRLVTFTPVEFRILRHLVENADRYVTHEELAEVLQAEAGERAGARPPRKGLVYQFISQIRKKLGPDAALIRNVRGLGYRIDPGYRPAAE